jgi:hypothetical protein
MYCMLLHVMSNFFSYIKAMKQKEIKAPIIYTTAHIPTSIQRNRKNLDQDNILHVYVQHLIFISIYFI